ncbi:MAG TPA: endonuclease/exonuclease/phosphatase family protein [Nocardioides sp.]|nr:endonuclease/exonuclease/phosphatase family protein [Nocardioides sp.]
MPRSRRLGHLKVAATVVLVVAFVTLFVGGATGVIGPGDDNGDAGSAGSTAADVGAPAGTDSSDTPTAAISPTDGLTPVVTGVPPQDVKGAKKLKRSLAWLRRGLADATTFRVGTFNVLGNSHTAKIGGNKRGYASGATRMGMAWSLINQADLDVIGFQELEDPQYGRFRSLGGSNWDLYPGPTLDRGSIRDSIAWRTDTWELVEANSIAVPYFHGQMIRRPVIKLKNKESGREVWFFNTHNPASTPEHGNNAHWRGVAIGIEVGLANQLAADGTPVVFTGDYNDRAEVFCPIVGGTDLEAANGGSDSGGCATPSHMDVDWIFGSGIQFSNFISASQGIVGRVSDHPFVYAQGYIPEEPLGGDQPTSSASPSDGSSPSDDSSG